MNRKQRRAQAQTGSGAAKTPPRKNMQGNIVHAAAVRSAEALLLEEKWDEAAEIYKVILKEDPSNTAALYNYGMILSDARGNRPMPEELALAASCFVKYLAKLPDDEDAMVALAEVRMDQGNAAESRSLMERVLQKNPAPRTLERIGTYFRKEGDSKKAVEYLGLAIAKAPNALGAYYNLGTTRGFSADDPSFTRLQGFARDDSKLPVKDKIHLHFTLGRAYLAQGDAGKAFHHYALGNKHKRGTYPRYDIAKTEQHAATLAGLFSEEFIDRFKGKNAQASSWPVFIIGMPRSGSTLADQILCSHPDVASVGEAPYFFKSIPEVKGEGAAPLFPQEDSARLRKTAAAMSPDMLDSTARRYLSLLKSTTPPVKRVVDKNLFNYLWVGMIRLALPDAKIVHCTRHPLDIGLSIWQLLFNADMPWAYEQSEIGRYYNSYEKTMAHWNKLFPGAIHEVNYETMVANQEEETRKLLDFCGLPWDDRCLRFHETQRHVQTASHSQVRKPMYKDSLQKWKKYEQYLGDLIKATGQE